MGDSLRLVLGVALPIAVASLQCNILFGQVVQLPTVGTFNISTTVEVPDGGTMNLGGIGSNRYGSTSRGGLQKNRAIGGGGGYSGASVNAMIIDLDELDRMIRSQATANPQDPKLSGAQPKAQNRVPSKVAARQQPAEYEYLAQMSGHGESSEPFDAENARYYLTLAENARQQGHWASVEVYYKLAWGSLPESRRDQSLKALADARLKKESAAKPANDTAGSRTKR